MRPFLKIGAVAALLMAEFAGVLVRLAAGIFIRGGSRGKRRRSRAMRRRGERKGKEAMHEQAKIRMAEAKSFEQGSGGDPDEGGS